MERPKFLKRRQALVDTSAARADQKSRKGHRPFFSRRGIQATAGASAVSLVAGLAACGSSPSTEYSNGTEMALANIIRPKTLQVGEAALQLEKQQPRKFLVMTQGNGVVELLGTSDNPKFGSGVIDVFMGITDGKPDPHKVLLADVTINGEKPNGASADGEIGLVTPGGTRFVIQAAPVFSNAVYGGNMKGYAAAETANVNGGSKALDTTDRDFYATNRKGNSLGPVRTARAVAHDIGTVLSFARSAFKKITDKQYS